jgi:hypothetical protein
MENFRVFFSTYASRSGSDHREMKRRLAPAAHSFVTIGNGTKGMRSDLKTGDYRERVLKWKVNSRYAGFTCNVVTAPQGKVCTKGSRKSLRRISGYPCDYLAPLTTRKK